MTLDYVVVSSYIYANKKDGYKAMPIFMLAKDGNILPGDDGHSRQTFGNDVLSIGISRLIPSHGRHGNT